MTTDKHSFWFRFGSPELGINPFWLLLTGGVVAVCLFLMTTPYYYLLLAAGPALIFVLYVLFVNPSFGLYLVLFMEPFDELRELGSQATRLLTVSKLAGALTLAAAVWMVVVRHPKAPQLRSNLWIWIGLFAFIVMISAFFNGVLPYGADYLRQLFTAAITMTLVYGFLQSKHSYKLIPVVLCVSVFVNALLATIGYYFEIPWLTIGTETASGLVRGTGFARNPNAFSSEIVCSLPFLAYWFATTDRFAIRLLSGAVLLFNIFAVMLTMSRGGSLFMFIILFLLFALHVQRLRSYHMGLVIALGIGIAGVGLLIIPQNYWERQISLVTGIKGITEDRSLERRSTYIEVGWDGFKESPLIGQGPEMFPDLYAQSKYAGSFVASLETGGGYYRRAHNIYLETLVETGLLGLGAFLSILVAGWCNFSSSISRFRKAGYPRMADLTRAYQIALLSQALFFTFGNQNFSKFYWALLGISVVATRLSRCAEDGIPITKESNTEAEQNDAARYPQPQLDASRT